MDLGYIDPGAGLLLWQLIVTGTLGALYYFRRAIRAIVGRFTGRTEEPASVSTDE